MPPDRASATWRLLEVAFCTVAFPGGCHWLMRPSGRMCLKPLGCTCTRSSRQCWTGCTAQLVPAWSCSCTHHTTAQA